FIDLFFNVTSLTKIYTFPTRRSSDLYGVGSLEQMLGFAFFPTRAAAIALSAFGILAIMLATTGIHGLVAYAVSRRTHEIGNCVGDRKSTRLNSSHDQISYAVFCLKKK